MQVEILIGSHVVIDKKGRKGKSGRSPREGLHGSSHAARDVRASMCPHRLARSFKPVTYHPRDATGKAPTGTMARPPPRRSHLTTCICGWQWGEGGESPVEKPAKWDFWESVGHLGKTGQEEQEVLCLWTANRDSVSRDGNGEVRKGGDLLPGDPPSFCTRG